MGETERITIAERRARRTDPVWRRRHQMADLRAGGLVGAMLVAPPVATFVSRPVGLGLGAAILIGGAGMLAWRGPEVGFERRTAALVGVPVGNVVILVPALWRAAHLGLQRWQGPLEPQWSDGTWGAAAAVGAVCWLASAGLLVLALR